MSVGALAIGEAPIAAQPAPISNSNGQGNGPPPKRTVVATSDVVAAPEPR
ncbi:MAG: hypothetical protein ACTHKE_08775 [Sphingomicrobium sp.]|jgi:hypothetical protein